MSLTNIGSQPKYGLIKKGGQKQTAAPPSRLKASSVFAKDELDDDDDGVVDIKKELVKRSLHSEKLIDSIAAKAMKEDPNIFDYDGAYEKMQSAKQENLNRRFTSSTATNEPPKAKYISSLQAASQLREKEQERIFERKLLKERAVEDEIYGDQPKYVTAAYKEKLMESKKWEFEDKMMEEVEKKHDVRSLGMTGFYAGLLTKNVAMGGDVKANAISAYTAGSERQTQVLEAQADTAVSTHQNTSSRNASSSSNNGGMAVENGGAERYASSSMNSSSTNNGNKRPRSPSFAEHDDTNAAVHTTIAATTTATKGSTAVVVNKEEAVLSARERYLARKKQATEGPTIV